MRMKLRHVSAMTLAAVTTTALALTTAPATAAKPTPERGHPGGWTGTWGAAHQQPSAPAGWPHNWSLEGFSDQSVRQVVRISAGGSQVRVRVSNRYGEQPLVVTRATVARAADGAAVRPHSVRTLRFDSARGVTVAPGKDLVSDAVTLPVRSLEKLTITLHFAGTTGPVSFHSSALTTTYRAEGDRTRDPSGQAFQSATSQSFYAVSGVEVTGPRTDGAVVAFGDSITDGAFSTPGADNRYPDQLAERLAAGRSRLSVVNSGIGGNRLLSDSVCFGEKGVDRFRHDALDRPGVRSAVVLIGINDIGAGGNPDFGCGLAPTVTARQLIDGHKALIRMAHARGVEVVGATITPFKGAGYGYYSEAKNQVRTEVNDWIRNSGAYDEVADLDRALRDPADPDSLLPAYDSATGSTPTTPAWTPWPGRSARTWRNPSPTERRPEHRRPGDPRTLVPSYTISRHRHRQRGAAGRLSARRAGTQTVAAVSVRREQPTGSRRLPGSVPRPVLAVRPAGPGATHHAPGSLPAGSSPSPSSPAGSSPSGAPTAVSCPSGPPLSQPPPAGSPPFESSPSGSLPSGSSLSGSSSAG
ncbi:GDSL-type esterase/lipase family protein [Streptomyces sp. NPDC051018]|uniref:SGNH/GDSL hydrolase family protein n=1 Tax=Streptomyces sp. NPDC051018 TaxID=3365639 RepID=UPI0037BD7394